MQLRPYQFEAVQSVYDYFATKNGNPCIAMPTGTGKSLVIAAFIQEICSRWPSQRILVCTHVKELLTQNSEKLKAMWPEADYGIYSAGLKRREKFAPVIFAGVASIVKNVEEFGHRDLMIVDEAHLINQKADSMYQKVVHQLRKINPQLKVVGLTATPYRMGQGYITDEGLFTDICYDITGRAAFNKMIADGYLSKVITKRSVTQLDVSCVGLGSDGDYNKTQLENAVDVTSVNYQVCKEMVEYAHERKTWLLFAAGIKHSNNIAEMLNSFGIPSVAVHSKMEREETLAKYKAGKLRCIVNNNVLTTGFDHPDIDFIGMLRPTTSTGLWVQMIGRGTRPAPNKENCLVLDFAGNTPRLGPINDPIIPRKKGSSKPGVAPIKICPQCSVYNYASARTCENCGYEFPAHVTLFSTAGTEEIIVSDEPVIEWFNVDRAIYGKNWGRSGKPSQLQVTYVCGLNAFSEYICLEHPKDNGAYRRAVGWWKKRMGSNSAPPTVDESLKYTGRLSVPFRIKVWTNKKYPEIMASEL